jgi:hypothetical protein
MRTEDATRGVHGCITANAPDQGGASHVTDPRVARERGPRGHARIGERCLGRERRRCPYAVAGPPYGPGGGQARARDGD